MGLSIVHGIVASYGGFITCDSEPGRGTVFRVFFPAIDVTFESDAKPVDKNPSGTERILIVDDELMLVESGKTMLEGLGYQVTAMTNSLEALSIFKNQPDMFDAIITDQTMPDMTGTELTRQLLDMRPDVPIILCTGHSSLINEELAIAAGAKGFLMKPFSKNIIATLIRKLLDDKRKDDNII